MSLLAKREPTARADLARVAVLLNANARQVGEWARSVIRESLPKAAVFLSRTRAEAERHVSEIVRRDDDLVLCGGGDGSAVALINAIRGLGAALPRIGLLKLGTGNGWARTTGAGALRWTLEKLKRDAARQQVATERFHLLEVEGILAPFAGAGWDARLLNDFVARHRGREGLFLRLRKSLAGYLSALALKSWPEEVAETRRFGRPQVVVRRLGGEAYGVGKGDALRPIGPEDTDVLYRGPVSVTGCATIESFGFGFRAHPFARARRGFMSFRAIDMPVARAVAHLPSLWRGTLRHRGIRDFLVRGGVRFEFSRPVPFQVGGDPMGAREAVDMRVSDVEVDVISWRAASGAR